MDATRFRIELEDRIKALPHKADNRDRDTQAVFNRLATYESIKEGTSVLELVSWKATIDENRNRRARVDGNISYKDNRAVSIVELILLSGTCCHNCCLNEQTIFVLEIIAGVPL